MHVPDDDDRLAARRRAIGEQIRAVRMHRNLTQERLHLAAGISRWSLQELEAGRGNPTLLTLLRISEVLEVSLADLVR
ncbi:helix-turn-helix transcriptional regulator [Streptomyces sp. ME02-6978a]|uniref:helix-turn-helix transcriptional regulator n=1 Tax=unclassified Streptomyces TaxID=2593676 RepID=UPI0029B22D76|nr:MULTISPECIES: helix-turn-helix transcriptional regulator [unclassified Streptomyces]MDX3087208.1 helix-turn-helix transcriptional regulator [Streptomyces sp. ME12-02E]MDX3336336.1 helix-turn-helix transcriptional regulator [Streptomyces sp. ME02-6978a]